MKKLLLLTIIISFCVKAFSQIYDYDGNAYDTIRIGDQVWMQENLKSLHYADGTIIDEVYVYDNNESNADIYGRYYTWDVTMNSSTEEKAQGVCPDNWHVPSISEWNELADYLGGASVAGGKMKVTGTEYWLAPNEGATNSSGFSALGAGEWDGAEYRLLHEYAVIWSSTQSGSSNAQYKYLSSNDAELHNYTYFKTLAYSVRCIMNTPEIIVADISGNTTESGGTASFTIRLNTEPNSDVNIELSSDNTDEGTVSPESVIFTSENWDTDQTITITGVDDDIDDGDIDYHIIINPAESNDPDYSGMDAEDIVVTNEDNDETVGIFDKEKTEKIVDIFPNPSSNYCFIKVHENKKIEKVELYSITGMKQDISADLTNNQAKIYFNNLPHGVYFIKVKSDQAVYTGKLIIK